MQPRDEMVDGLGGIRQHWRDVLRTLSAFDPGEMGERMLRMDRAAREEGANPTWRCDPVPLPLTAEEFADLEDGLCQRARLLDAFLADIYGPQAILAEGIVPPALVHANPAFLRPCRATLDGQMPAGPFLQSYAADLVRNPDGSWSVLADRTRVAMGIGYARECRRLIARVMPELFRSTQVRQLRPFFESWQEALLQSGALPGEAAFVALLAPGVDDPHWAEHLALSRDLSCALVEARDLTVRSGVLHLKTLRGLQRVDVLLRRVPGAGLDALELQGGTQAGVTGLLQAQRQGAVRVLNHPGAACVEAPAFGAFLPEVCRWLLGETLLLPNVETLWLGDPAARKRVMQEPERWAIRPALDPAARITALAQRSPEERAELDSAIDPAPWTFAAQAVATPSLAPCQGPAGRLAEPVAIRMYAMHDGFGWRVMPGGLARVLPSDEELTEALPPGAVLKDLWVLSQDTRTIRGPEPLHQPPVTIRRSSGDLPSRIADDFFWLGRYVERLDAQARIGRAGLLRRARGLPLPREISELRVLIRCLWAAGLAEAEEGVWVDEAVRLSLLRRGSISTVLDHVRRLTAAVRERLTPETHAAFQDAAETARSNALAGMANVDGLVHAMTGLQRLATIVAGVAAEGMVQGGSRLFLDLGRRAERGQTTALLLATVLNQPAARIESMLRLALELCDSAITYRNRYRSVVQPAPVLDLVLADTGNPRALAYQFAQLRALLATAGDQALAAYASDLHSRVDTLVDRVLRAASPVAEATALSGPLFTLGAETAGLSDRIARRFFALLPVEQSVGVEVG